MVRVGWQRCFTLVIEVSKCHDEYDRGLNRVGLTIVAPLQGIVAVGMPWNEPIELITRPTD